MSSAGQHIERGPGGGVPAAGAAVAAVRGDDGPMTPYYAYRVAEALVRVLPRRAAYGVAVGCVEVLRTVRPGAVRGLRSNLAHVLPDLDRRSLERVVRRNLRDLGRAWVDVMAMRFQGDGISDGLVVDHMERYQEAAASGRGVAVISLHLGSWEKGLAAGNSLGFPMALLAEYLRPPQLFERVVGSRRAQGVRIVPIDIAAIRGADEVTARRLGAAAMRDVLRILKSGGAIALALDRDLIGNGERFPFFGAEAPFPVGVVDAAMRAGSVILPVVLPRVPGGVGAFVHEEIAYDRAAPRHEELRRVTLEILGIFEGWIREFPEQWHVLDPVWGPEP
jgi:KDO2-lipid IV(A) lauroyltransferase